MVETTFEGVSLKMRQLDILCIGEERKSRFEVESHKMRKVTRAAMLKQYLRECLSK